MKFKRLSILLLLLLVFLVSMGASLAVDNNNYNNTDLSSANSLESDVSLSINDNNQYDDTLNIQQDDVLSANVITVDDSGYNQMSTHTIQNAIDGANAGDTILITGDEYIHCHILINKKLNIVSEVGTKMSTCPGNISDSGYYGIFYITPEASGTVIQGFTFETISVYGDNDYGILINGASDVQIKDCTVNNYDYGDAIRLENAKNTVIQDSIFNGARIGIHLIGSTQTTIINNSISNNLLTGISVDVDNRYVTIEKNNITKNKATGINMSSAEHVYIKSNYIADNQNSNSGAGVYVNCNLTEIDIRGNVFLNNGKYGVLNDYRVKNMLPDTDHSRLELIDNNYFMGHSERVAYHIKAKKSSYGDFTYDSASDTYAFVGTGNGDWDLVNDVVYLGKNVILGDTVCGSTYGYDGKNYDSAQSLLTVSSITQVRKGVYSISIVDNNGDVVTDFNSVWVIFYINKEGNSIYPQSEDVYKQTVMENGVATVRFYGNDFNETGNVISAVLPQTGKTISTSDAYKTFNVADSDIPGSISNTTIKISNLNTFPKSNVNYVVTLLDENSNPLANQPLTIKIGTATYNKETDENGKVTLKINLAKEGTYAVSTSFDGVEGDYFATSSSAKIVVKKTNTKIVSSNVYMIPKMSENYVVTLKDASNNVISGQTVTFKVNGKTYSKKTDSKGQAKVSLKFTSQKSYKITISYAGSNKYNSVKKTNTINVKYSSKTAKLTAPSVTIAPKTSKTYTVTLKDASGKAISKQKVTIKINGKTYTKTTNSKGQASVSVKFTAQKTYKVSANYKGSNIYKKASASGKIKVAKTGTKIIAPSVSVTPQTSYNYAITLKTSTGKVISKQKLTISLNGKTYTKTTDSKGQVKLAVKFSTQKTYKASVSYKGSDIYTSSKATGSIKVQKLTPRLVSYDRIYSRNATKEYVATLFDNSGKAMANQPVNFKVGNESYKIMTDSNGKARLNVNISENGEYDIVTSFAGTTKFFAASNSRLISVIDKNLNDTLIGENMSSNMIQSILNDVSEGSNVEFLGSSYDGISLVIKKGLNISTQNTTLNGKLGSPVFKIISPNVVISNFVINANSDSGIVVSAQNVNITDNVITNNLDQSKKEEYENGSVSLPGYGIHTSDASDVIIINNTISLFESGIFSEDSDNIKIRENTISKSNYGIKYGFGVSNTEITYNLIVNNTGLYVTDVPEGPRGYGIFLNNSAVNVSITHNRIVDDYIGISVDANYSTGIVITSNLITDNALEGIRFNAGYDLAENAVEPIVTDNAIYRNAKIKSLMVLGEMSANPFGIYGPGEFNESLRLLIGPNWYGNNERLTWDEATGIVGFGTMCPRIQTTYIPLNNTVCITPGTYQVSFYKDGKVDADLPEFDLYATLNNQHEVHFNVVNGVGEFSFDTSCFTGETNTIQISIGSLLNSSDRTFTSFYSFAVLQSGLLA